MYEESIVLLEMPEHDSISVCVFNEQTGLFELGERIGEKYEDAYMNGYNWDALIRFYVAQADPKLMTNIDTDPEAGSFSAYTSFSDENLEHMKAFRQLVLQMVADEEKLMAFIETHYDEIEWD